MHLPFRRPVAYPPQLRRALLFLWFPAISALLFSACSFLIKLNQPTPISHLPVLAQSSGGLFAAAPPRSQILGDSLDTNKDNRVQLLTNYLKSKGSPLAPHAGTFITVADRYGLDWRLLPAIAGKESTFGRHIPKGSYNAWGWGIPTGSSRGKGFSSWDEGIEVVGYGLRHRYFNRGLDTLAEIGSAYTPPSAADPSHPWRNGVARFMAEIGT